MKLVKNTIGHLFLNRIKVTPQKEAVGFISENKITRYSFSDYKKKVESLSLMLIKKGIKNQDKICILSQTRLEWNLFDLAIMCSGAVTVPIYNTYNSSEVKYIVNHSEAKLIVIEDDYQFKKVLNEISNLESLKFIIAIEKIDKNLISKLPSKIEFHQYKSFFEDGVAELVANPDLFEIRINSIHDENIATIIYTSGTTGEPKGAVITQAALLKMLSNIKAFTKGSLNKNDRSLSFLPLSHVLGRCDSFLNLIFGCETIYAESIEKLLENIQLVKPTFMIAVPRIFEKVYEKVTLDLEQSSIIKKNIFSWAMNSCDSYFSKIEKDKTPSSKEIIQYNLAQKLVTNKVYEKFGGRIRYFISGGAPLSPDIIKFLRNSNLTLIEGYGLTETIAPCVLNPFEKQKIGTVGKPIGDVEIKFSEDSEILIRTKAMLSEYYKNPEATSQAIDEGGWFHSGDIGKFDSDGYLKITDRKKDIIITSGGKNIAPQKIEGILKLSSAIDQVVVIGDRRKYLTALISITDEYLENSQLHEIIKKEVESLNAKLSKFETIKKFHILDFTLSTENYLTPSLKVKKKLLIEDFTEVIDSMYHD